MTLRHELSGLRPGSTTYARVLLSSASFLNCVQRVAPGGFRHLRNGWNVVNESGIMELRRLGDGRAEVQVAGTEELRNDVAWRRRAPGMRPLGILHFTDRGGFVWPPRPVSLREKASPMGPDALFAMYADAESTRGRGASLADSFIQGAWPELASREGIDWKEFWVLKGAVSSWREHVERK